MKKRIISIFLLVVVVIGVATTAIISSLAYDTEDELYDYAKFEVDYLMNMVEYNGDILNGSANVYDMVIKDDFFNHKVYYYLQSHPVLREITVTQVNLYDNGINLAAHPEHFYSVVLMDILQSKDLQDLSKDSVKSTVASDVDRIIQMTFLEDCDNLIDNLGIQNISQLKAATLGELPNETVNKIVDNIADTTSAHVGFKDLSGILGYALDIHGSVVDVVNKIDSLYAIAGYNLKAIEALMQISYRADDPFLKMAANDIIGIYSEMDSADEVAEIMSIAGQNATGYAVDKLFYYSTKYAVSILAKAVGIGAVLDVWDVGTSMANICFKVNDLNTGYLLVEAATVVEDAFRRHLSTCSKNYLSSGSVRDAERCRTAYKLVLTTQYYANEIVDKLGYTIANEVFIWSALRKSLGFASYDDLKAVCDATRTRIEQRYYNWVALAQKMYKIIYGVSFNHAITATNIPVTSVSFTKFSSYTLFSNEGILNRAVVAPSNATDSEVRYYSSNNSVAVVGAYGNISAVGPGVATITAYTSNGKSATCEITVLPYDATVVDGSYTIDKFTGGASYANVPTRVNGINVTRIGDGAFKGTKVTGATIPDSIIYIGASAFENCTSLSSVVLSNYISAINAATFKGCSSLGSITFPRNVASIGAEAFRACNSFVNVTIPNHIKVVGNAAFDDCKSLNTLVVGDGVSNLSGFNFQAMPNLTNVTIGVGVSSITSEEFMGCSLLKNVTMKGAIISIGDRAFKNCPVLNDVALSDFMLSIGTEAFYGCSSLVNVTIPDGVTSVGAGAFNSCANLKNLVIGDGVTTLASFSFGTCPRLESVTIGNSVTDSIEKTTFAGCANLTDIVIGDSVPSIGDEAFRAFRKLKNVHIGKGVTSIVQAAFLDCDSIVDFVIPDNVTSLGSNFLYSCDNLTNLVIGDGVENLDSFGFNSMPKLKSVIIGEGITSIADEKFRSCYALESVTIGSNVTAIGISAFANCTKLQSVVIPDRVSLLGNSAFQNCTSLGSVVIGNGLTVIEDSTFYGCTSLAEITIGKAVNTIKSQVFIGCTSLEKIIVPEESTSFYSDDSGVLFNEELTELVQYPLGNSRTSYTIPDSVIVIRSYAFQNSSYLEDLIITGNVKAIANNTFEKCSNLATVIIPDSVTDIGNFAFHNCPKLTELTMPVSAKIYNSPHTFGGCYNIQKITLTKGNGTAQAYATSTSSSSSSYPYYQYTPWYISKCPTIVIDEEVKHLGSYMFYSCTSVKDVYYTGDLAGWCALKFDDATANPLAYGANLHINGEMITDLVIPGGVTIIGNYTFVGCDTITSITIPGSVTTIGSYAFYACDGITSITIPDGVKTISSYAFLKCSNLTNVIISDSVTHIDNSSFYYCSKLTELTMPVSAKINGSAFTGCTGIQKITLTKGNGTAQDCQTSTSGNWNYYENSPWYISRCPTIVIDKEVKNLGSDMFYECTSIKDVYYTGDLAGWCALNFDNIYANPFVYGANLHINGEKITDLVIPDGVTTIGNYTFAGCDTITSITIPGSVTTIGSYAFYDCDGITTLTIPDGVTTIGTYAFLSCSNLTNAIISDSVTYIDNSSFNYCSKLTELTMPVSARINLNAFAGCTGIQKITLTKGDGTAQDCNKSTNRGWNHYENTPWYISRCPTIVIDKEVKNLGYYMFYECTQIKDVYYTGDVAGWCALEFDDTTANPLNRGANLHINGEKITDLVIPDGVTTIGKCAFAGCDAITSITIPGSVTTIGSYAFCDCDGITTLTIPDGVTTIGTYAFQACSNLTNVIISDSVKYIDNSSFYYCSKLTELTMPVSMQINSNAFAGCTGIQKITLTKGNGTAQDCHTSTNRGWNHYENTPWYISRCPTIVIDKEVKNLGYYMFYECTQIKDVYYTGDVAGWCALKFDDTTANPLNCGANLHINGEKITDLVIPDGVTTIGNCAFAGCDTITSVTIPYGVTTIGTYAFQACSNLTNVIISDSVTHIDNSSFYYCSKLTELTMPVSVQINSNAFAGCTGIQKITLTKGNGTAQDCHQSTNRNWNHYENTPWYTSRCPTIVIDEEVKHLGSNMFYKCTSIKDVYYTGDLAGWCAINFSNTASNPLNCGANLHINGEKITDLVIPDGLTTTGNYTFAGCDAITSVTIPGSVTTIGSETFYDCDGITSITIPDGVKTISFYAFQECSNLTNIIISDSVTQIGYRAFENCSKLTELTMPISAKIYNSADTFGGCYNIQKITLTKGNGSVHNYDTSTISSGNNYKYTPWYISRCPTVVFEDGIKIIGNNMFNGCSGLVSVTIGNDVETIGSYAFQDCKKLAKVSLPINVKSIGSYAFAGCTSLEKIKIYNRKCTLNNGCIGTNVTICGYAGSTAEAYATQYGCKFELIPDDDHEHIYSNPCDNICDKCETVNPERGHTYSYGCDTECDICDFVRSDIVHTLDNDCDSDCNYCDFTRLPPHTDKIADGICDVCENSLSCISVGVSQNVSVSAEESIVYIRFVTKELAKYTFSSSADVDTYGYIFDADKNQLAGDDDSGEGTNFSITYTFEPGVVYYLGARYYKSGISGEIPVTIRLDEVLCAHEGTHTEHTDSTCLVNGYDKVVCDVCERVISSTELPLSDHVYKSTVVPPSCEDEGNTIHYCKVCKISYIDEITEPTGHSYGEWVVTTAPTCTGVGIETATCSVCSGTKTQEVPVTEHKYQTIQIDPTCTEKGNVIYCCRDCRYSYTGEVIPEKGHTKVWSVITEPTCTQEGFKQATCSVCNEVVETVVIPALVFEFTEGATIDFETDIISGINAGESTLDNYTIFVNEDYAWSYETTDGKLGTGSKAVLKDEETVITEYTIVIFGDVNGDGWYDGTDSIIVSCLANGMLTKDDVSEAVYMAADCNHDGVIDQLDVDLLNQAGTLLANVDQTKSTEDLLETSSEYVEYLELIDQSPEIGEESESQTPSLPEETPKSEEPINLIDLIISIIRSFFEMLLANISTPIK